MPKKVLLITPPYHCGVLESAGSWMPLGMIYVAGSLQKSGHEVRIYDAMTKFHTFDDIKKYIIEYSPDAVGTMAYTSSLHDAILVLRIAKEVNIAIVPRIPDTHTQEETS